jgi:hypothetical protein
LARRFGTFQLHHRNIFDQEIAAVFSGRLALVGNGKRSFGGGPDASQGDFSQQRTLVDLFQESGAKGVGDFGQGPSTFPLNLRNLRLCLSAFSGVHLRPILLFGRTPKL